jgi:hypothetical protein
LNTDLWSFSGTGFGANGIQLFAHRPVLFESITNSKQLTASATGAWNTSGGSPTTAFSCLDTSALFGLGADNPGVYATYSFAANVTGGAGSAGSAGGWYLTAAYQTAAAAAGTPATAGTGIYRAQAYPSYEALVAGQSPLAWWELTDASGSDTAADSSGNNHTGAATAVSFGIATSTALLPFTCAQFGATSTISTTYQPGLAGVTVEAWVNLDGLSQTGTPTLMASSQTGSDNKGFVLELSGGNAPAVVFGNSITHASVASGTAVPASGWTYMAGTMGAGTVALYVNGVTQGITTLAGNMAAGTAAGIGVGFNPGSGAGNVSGLLAQCAIYGSVLTAAQISAHYQSGLSMVPVYAGNGVIQAQGTAATACSYFTDLLNVGPGTATTWWPGVLVADASATTRTPPSDGVDTSGLTSRVTWAWAGVSTGGSTVTQVPAPQQTWTAAITTTQLNGPTGPRQALTFLNNPPLFKVAQGLSSSVAGSALSVLSFGSAATIDTYSGWNGTNAYTAQLPGLYLAAPLVSFAANAGGQRFAGLSVAGTQGTTTLQGGAYLAVGTGGVTSAGQIRVLDLQAGDTVSLAAGQTSGGALALAGTAATTRLVLAYLCPYSSGGVASATPPYTPFRWQAGFTAAQLPSLLSQHLGNDLSFLVNKPYMTGYQGSAQTGFVNGTWNAVTIDTVGGLIHGSNGDNYSGWSATQNAYVAQQPGWYLAIFEGYASLPGSVSPGPYLTAGFNVPTSGGVPPLTSPDWYQSCYFPMTAGSPPGVSGISCYYLSVGESVQPMMRAQNWGGSWATYVSATTKSQFSAIFLCE